MLQMTPSHSERLHNSKPLKNHSYETRKTDLSDAYKRTYGIDEILSSGLKFLSEKSPHGKKAIAKKQRRNIIVCPTLILSGNEKRKTGWGPPINGTINIITIPIKWR
jgi:hypothetical protein